MKTRIVSSLAVSAAVLISAVVAQSKYSGIYGGNVSTGAKFLAAVTKGGRVLGIDSTTEGIHTALAPSKSTVDSSGHIKGATPDGSSLVGTINADFKFSGTMKTDRGTARLSGKRIYN